MADTDPAAASRMSAAKAPVIASLRAGVLLLVQRFPAILLRTWPLLVLIAGAGLWLSPFEGIEPARLLAPGAFLLDMLPVYGLLSVQLVLHLMLLAKLLRLALDRESAFALFRVEIGPDEIRLLAWALMLFGAFVVFAEGAKFFILTAISTLENIGFAVSGPGDGEDLSRALAERDALYIVIAGFIALFSVSMFLWLATRSLAAPALFVAERRLGLFDAMAATKGSTWRLLLLLVLFAIGALVLTLVVGQLSAWAGPSVGLGLSLPFGPDDYADQVFNPSTDGFLPGWIVASFARILTSLALTTVAAGALAHLYRALVPATAAEEASAAPRLLDGRRWFL